MTDPIDFSGRMLVDRDGENIGKVTDVVSDPVSLEPEWLVVKLGRLAGEHLVPYRAVTAEDGRLAVDLRRDDVKTTPRVHEHIMPSSAERDLLYRRYGLVA